MYGSARLKRTINEATLLAGDSSSKTPRFRSRERRQDIFFETAVGFLGSTLSPTPLLDLLLQATLYFSLMEWCSITVQPVRRSATNVLTLVRRTTVRALRLQTNE